MSVFGSKKPLFQNPAKQTFIGEQVIVRGDIEFSGELIIKGQIIGNIIAVTEIGQNTLLKLDNTGKIEGEVCAPVVEINGTMQGNIYASERVILDSEARMHGDIHYKAVEIEKGAQLTGSLLYNENVAGLPSSESIEKAIEKTLHTEKTDN